ncbi:hypothetical protein TRSC58_04663 [Trypanosoma rangeli SC58]|uniref:Methyltransferase domain-containing protein n=1 Tax=Trypanosoma rangeli SC58 TaxID=429131 RepID=A0A061IYA3_TRYRA|nr:hypothetical protein TRSC58_04663 [Trypanosoma rangeli SC58]
MREESSMNEPDAKPFSTIPLTTALVSSKLRHELQHIWNVARRQDGVAPEAPADECGAENAVDVPPFKVGTMEMYRRFPKQYDLLMRRHDCRAVQEYLDSLVSSLQQPPPASDDEEKRVAAVDAKRGVRVADFGCGTGRIASMLCRHPAVSAVYCYDSETPMLRECLTNVVRSVAETRRETCGVCICPRATARIEGNDEDANVNTLDTSAAAVCVGSTGATAQSPGAVLLCARPVSFGDVQSGFLSTHPSCHLVVCAWSLSYVMRAQWGGDRWHAAVDATLAALIGLLDTSGAAALVIIETLGTDSIEPRRNNTLPQRLEAEYGFEQRWVRTDYKFRDTAEAVALTRFFFGESMARRMAEEERTVLPECTGIWTRWRR